MSNDCRTRYHRGSEDSDWQKGSRQVESYMCSVDCPFGQKCEWIPTEWVLLWCVDGSNSQFMTSSLLWFLAQHSKVLLKCLISCCGRSSYISLSSVMLKGVTTKGNCGWKWSKNILTQYTLHMKVISFEKMYFIPLCSSEKCAMCVKVLNTQNIPFLNVRFLNCSSWFAYFVSLCFPYSYVLHKVTSQHCSSKLHWRMLKPQNYHVTFPGTARVCFLISCKGCSIQKLNLELRRSRTVLLSQFKYLLLALIS